MVRFTSSPKSKTTPMTTPHRRSRSLRDILVRSTSAAVAPAALSALGKGAVEKLLAAIFEGGDRAKESRGDAGAEDAIVDGKSVVNIARHLY